MHCYLFDIMNKLRNTPLTPIYPICPINLYFYPKTYTTHSLKSQKMLIIDKLSQRFYKIK